MIIKLTKKTGIILGTTLAIVALIGGGYYSSDCYARRELKAMYDGANRPCFDNVVTYRMTNTEVRGLLRFMKELKVRPNAVALEFMDPQTIQSINLAYQVCQPRVAPVQQVQPHPQLQQPVPPRPVEQQLPPAVQVQRPEPVQNVRPVQPAKVIQKSQSTKTTPKKKG